MKDYLKEKLNTHRANKTLLWQTMLLTIGGDLGLFLKAINGKTNLPEIILMTLGVIIIIFLGYLTGSISNEIVNLHKQLKQEGAKNE